MIDARPIDVLLVGSDFDFEERALAGAGLTVRTSRTGIDAVSLLSRGRARVVVLSYRDVEGRLEATAEGLREAGGDPALLVRVPPSHDATELRASGIATIEEPYFPVQFQTAIRERLERDLHRALDATPPAGGDADLIPGLEHLRDRPALFDSIVGVFLHRSGASRGALYLPDDDPAKLRLVHSIGFDPTPREGQCIPLESGMAARAVQEGRPILVTDLSEMSSEEETDGPDYGTSSCIVVPLVAGERLQGLLILADRSDGRAFTDGDLAPLARLAPPAARSLEVAAELERLQKLSIIDDLTRLYNARHFRNQLDTEFGRALRHDQPLTLAILDLDYFKTYNDRYGHEAGNRALRRVGEILATSFRNIDIVCRYGGEEFAVIFPVTNVRAPSDAEDGAKAPAAFPFLERLRVAIETETFDNGEEPPSGHLTISGGVASYPDDAATMQELKEVADQALFRAKNDGRNRIDPA